MPIILLQLTPEVWACVQRTGDLTQWLLGGIISSIIFIIFSSKMLAVVGHKADILYMFSSLKWVFSN